MNKHEAQSLVMAELEKTKDKYEPIDYAILLDETIEKEWGWVFFYQSKAFVESGDFSEMLSGNTPIIVNRHSGELFYTGSAFEIGHYIEEYEDTLFSDT